MGCSSGQSFFAAISRCAEGEDGEQKGAEISNYHRRKGSLFVTKE